MICRSRFLIFAWLMTGFALCGCGKSQSSSSAADSSAGTAADSSTGTLTRVQKEAQAAAFAEIAKHFARSDEGWTAALTAGSPGSPEHFIRQFRDIPVDAVQGSDLEDAEKLNGVEWKGVVTFKQLSCREAGDPGAAMGGMAGMERQRGQWSPWFNTSAEGLSLTKTKGEWAAYPSGLLLRGELPTAADFTSAGVK